MLAAVNAACDGEDATDAIEMTIKTELKADYVKAEVRRLAMNDRRFGAVSYTHLTLPTILRV